MSRQLHPPERHAVATKLEPALGSRQLHPPQVVERCGAAVLDAKDGLEGLERVPGGLEGHQAALGALLQLRRQQGIWSGGERAGWRGHAGRSWLEEFKTPNQDHPGVGGRRMQYTRWLAVERGRAPFGMGTSAWRARVLCSPYLETVHCVLWYRGTVILRWGHMVELRWVHMAASPEPHLVECPVMKEQESRVYHVSP